MVEQQRGELLVVRGHGDVQGVEVEAVLDRDVRAGREQHLGDRFVLVAHGVDQRGLAGVGRLGVDLRACGNQGLDDLLVAVPRRLDQRRDLVLAVVDGRLGGEPRLEQRLDRVDVVVLDGHGELRPRILVGGDGKGEKRDEHEVHG